MKSKTWLILFPLTILLVLAVVSGLNLLTDPFGVFGDPLYDWYAYNFTNNPRAAKLAYLDENAQSYDSILIGASTTSSYSVERLNQYMDATFFNLFGYGADMHQTRLMAEYALENYPIKNLVLNVSVNDGEFYDIPLSRLTDLLPARADGSSRVDYTLKYLLANPRYAMTKITSNRNQTYLPQTFDVFDAQTGAYNKSRRDAEAIGGLADYVQQNAAFKDHHPPQKSLLHTDECIADIAAVLALCREKNVNVLVVCAPFHQSYLQALPPGELAVFLKKLAGVTDFWDFSRSSVGLDARYFYDPGHFRNAAGDMALARIFDDGAVYIPPDFGFFVTAQNVDEYTAHFDDPLEDVPHETALPVLTYHHLAETGGSNLDVTPTVFEAHMAALTEAGYQSVSLAQITDYVEKGTALPDKPILITFDDGYLSNYELAYPILQKYEMKAVIFIIGRLVGRDTYSDADQPIVPHFSYTQAAEMSASGLIEIQSHTYNMHQSEAYETGVARTTAQRRPEESESAFIELFRADFIQSKEEIEQGTGAPVTAYSYPLGDASVLTDALLRDMGVKITLTTKSGVNVLVKGLPQSLLQLKRLSMRRETSAGALLSLLEEAEQE